MSLRLKCRVYDRGGPECEGDHRRCACNHLYVPWWERIAVGAFISFLVIWAIALNSQ